MNRCPKCGRYMNSHIEYVCGEARVIWSCDCGYLNKNESYTIDNKTYVVKDNMTSTTNHT